MLLTTILIGIRLISATVTKFDDPASLFIAAAKAGEGDLLVLNNGNYAYDGTVKLKTSGITLTCESPGGDSLQCVFNIDSIIFNFSSFKDAFSPLHLGKAFCCPSLEIKTLSQIFNLLMVSQYTIR